MEGDTTLATYSGTTYAAHDMSTEDVHIPQGARAAYAMYSRAEWDAEAPADLILYERTDGLWFDQVGQGEPTDISSWDASWAVTAPEFIEGDPWGEWPGPRG